METAALQKRDVNPLSPVVLTQGLVPQTMGEAFETAKLFAGSQLVPAGLKGKPADVLLIMMKGLELGLKPVQSLSEIYVVNGRPGCSAKLKMALCISRPDICEYFTLVESTNEKCTYVAKRKGAPKPVTFTYTIEDAARAGLTGKDTWKAHPKAMLRARCASGLSDGEFPELVQGLATLDELDEVREREVRGPAVRVVSTGVPETTAPEATSSELPAEPVDDFDYSAAPPAPPTKAEVAKALDNITSGELKGKEPAPVEDKADDVDLMLKRIEAATDGKALEALVPEIKKLSSASKLMVKKAYADRRSAINAAADQVKP